jgi:hypothetical protein
MTTSLQAQPDRARARRADRPGRRPARRARRSSPTSPRQARDEALAGDTRVRSAVAPAVPDLCRRGRRAARSKAVKPDGHDRVSSSISLKPVVDFIARPVARRLADRPHAQIRRARIRLFRQRRRGRRARRRLSSISEVVFIPTVPYARPIEAGESKQAQVPRRGACITRSPHWRARGSVGLRKIDFAWRGVSGRRRRAAGGRGQGALMASAAVFTAFAAQARDLVEYRVDLSGK